jgi:hypothetical protein
MSPSTEVRENREFAAEYKFVVPRPVAEEICRWSRACLAPDPNAAGELGDTYQIRTFYFDTDQFHVFHRKGSFGRSKYRIRRYGESTVVFLERKLKTRGLVSKRRSPVRLDELPRLFESELESSWNGRWYYRRLTARRLNLVCLIEYRRMARVAVTSNGPVRLTVDDHLRACIPHELSYEIGPKSAPLLDDQLVVELKFRGETPVVFKRLIEEFHLNPVANSKYRRAVMALGLAAEAVEQSESAAWEREPVG